MCQKSLVLLCVQMVTTDKWTFPSSHELKHPLVFFFMAMLASCPTSGAHVGVPPAHLCPPALSSGCTNKKPKILTTTDLNSNDHPVILETPWQTVNGIKRIYRDKRDYFKICPEFLYWLKNVRIVIHHL